MTNISLTITGIQSNIFVKNIEDTAFSKNFVSYNNNKSLNSMIKESYTNIMGKIDINKLPSYDNSDFIYYPYLDIYNMGANEPKTRIILSELPKFFNTNGFFTDLEPNKIYSNMFKRFDNKMSGLFVKNERGKVIIPHILHHLWLDFQEPIKNYTNAWGRILKEPWMYMVWTENNLRQDVLKNSKWEKIYYNENQRNRLLIAYLAILEKYGGFVIDSFTLPLKLIPDEMLTSKFMMSFMDEKNFGTKLSYRIMASVPGEVEKKMELNKKYDAARRPFEGPNNFFRDIKTTKLDKLDREKINNENNIIIFPLFFENIHRILSIGGDDKLQTLENYIINNPDVIIYPSYYFNPNTYIFPKKLLKLAICINLWKLITEKTHNKTSLTRNYKINTQGIIAQLEENPKDRLKNLNKS